MQEKEKKPKENIDDVPATGRLVALDPGTKRIGVAVSDPDRIVCTPLTTLKRSSWKTLLLEIEDIIVRYDAAALIVGLPLNSDGTDGEMTREARKMASKFALSLEVPVYLQDERITTFDARRRLWDRGVGNDDLKANLDSEAAAVILSDFLSRLSN